MTNLRVNVDSRMMVYTEIKRAGGDPSLFFEILEGAIERRDWEYLTDDDGVPVGSFRRYIEAPYPVGCGMKPEKLEALLHVEHRYEADTDFAERMASLRGAVKLMLDGELPMLPKHGEIGNGRLRNTKSKSDTDDAEYALRRLKRDNPELAERVMAGELSAHAAAVEAGFRSPKVAVRLDDMRSAARTLASRLDAEQIDDLIIELDRLRGK